jgi:hypothetical protein
LGPTEQVLPEDGIQYPKRRVLKKLDMDNVQKHDILLMYHRHKTLYLNYQGIYMKGVKLSWAVTGSRRQERVRDVSMRISTKESVRVPGCGYDK